MSYDLKKIVLWSRTYHEYVKYFSLTKIELRKNILSCADGATSFNFEATKLGSAITPYDPIYHLSADEILERINKDCRYLYPLIKNHFL